MGDEQDGAATPGERTAADTRVRLRAQARPPTRARPQRSPAAAASASRTRPPRPREPTLAERRARERAARREREAEEQRLADEQAGRKKRKRILIGSGVAAGLAAIVALGYVVAQPEEEVTANCVDENGVVVDDTNCAVPANEHHVLRRRRLRLLPDLHRGRRPAVPLQLRRQRRDRTARPRRNDHRAPGRHTGAYVVGQLDGHPRRARACPAARRPGAPRAGTGSSSGGQQSGQQVGQVRLRRQLQRRQERRQLS